MLIILILISSFATRFYDLAYPKNLIFDENYFIPMAEKYIDGEFYGDPHPPLGRLIITSGALLYPDSQESNESEDQTYHEDIIKYRIPTVFFASLVPLLVFLIAKFFTRSNAFSSVAAFLVVFDNAIITHSRYALFDEILNFFVLASILFSLYYVRIPESSKDKILEKKQIFLRILLLTLASFFAGAAISTKFIGLSAAGILFLCILYKTYKDRIRLSLKSHLLILSQILIPFFVCLSVFFLSYWIHFQLFTKSGENLEEFSSEFQECIVDKPNCKMSLAAMTFESVNWSFNYEKHVPALDLCKDGEIGSAPYQWPFMARAIPFSFKNLAGLPLSEVSYIYLSGNPIVWLAGLIGIVVSFCLIIVSLFQVRSLIDKGMLFLFIAYTANFVPYFFIERVMYFYHYFLALIFSIILFSVLAQKFYQLHIRKRLAKVFRIPLMVIFLLIIVIVFLFYSPLTYNIKISTKYMERLILTDFWNLKVDPFGFESE